MKKLIAAVLIPALLFLPAFCIIRVSTTLPDTLTVVKGESVSVPTGNLVHGYVSDTASVYETNDAPLAKQSGSNLILTSNKEGNYDVDLKLFGFIPVKTINVNVCDDDCVIPGGQVIGIKIHTDGVMVVALSTLTSQCGESLSPARAAGLQAGDVITAVNGTKIKNSAHFAACINNIGENEADLDIVREGENASLSLTPVKTEFDFKIGAWVRDSTAGLGTLTFVRPQKNVYAALGHGISDIDTSQLLSVLSGDITDCRISSIRKGASGTPGEIKGIFKDETFGSVRENSSCGIYGIWSSAALPNAAPIKVMGRFETHEGDAKIRFSLNGGEPSEYSVSIEKVFTKSTDEKGMVIRITDPALLAATGGIVQGMSGCPIIQDGKLAGAVTHVFVNDPTMGYAIFAELMMDKTENIS